MTLVQCPYCNVKWIAPEIAEVCIDCEEPYKIDQTVVALHNAVQDLDKLNFNKLNSKHRQAVRAALTHLDAIMEVLERIPPKV